MRFTTKIVWGIVAAIFALSIIFIIYAAILYKKNGQEYYRNQYNPSSASIVIPQDDLQSIVISQDDLQSIRLDSFKVICLEPMTGVVDRSMNLAGGLIIQPKKMQTESASMTLSAHLMSYIKSTIVSDTLKIKIDCQAVYEAYKDSKEKKYLNVRGLDINLYLSNREIKVISRIADFAVSTERLEADKVDIATIRGDVIVNSCIFGRLNTEYAHGHLAVDKSTIDTLSLDLDNMIGWTVVDSQIDVENLTGSNYHNVYQSKKESNTVNWLPKNKKALLNVQLAGDTARIVFP